MTLHYRKLLIASIAFPILVLGLLLVLMPTLMEARSSSVFSRMRSNIKTLEMQVEMAAALNRDDTLIEPLAQMRETVASQQDTLIDMRDVLLDEAEQGSGPGAITMISVMVGIAVTLSSVILSWRQDMREVRSESNAPRQDSLPAKKDNKRLSPAFTQAINRRSEAGRSAGYF